MKHLWPWLLAAASGPLMALAFPPYEHSALAWVSLVPLLVAAWFGPRARGGREALRLLGLGYVSGLGFFWMSLHWLTEVTVAGWVVFAFYLALYPALWTLFAGLCCRPRDPSDLPSPISHLPPPPNPWLSSSGNLHLALRAAAGWVALEWARGTLFTGFGWNSLGVALWQNLPIIQITEFTGVAGLSFLVVLVNVILVMTGRRLAYEAGTSRMRPHFDFTLTMALVLGSIAFGLWRTRQPAGLEVPLRVAAVQANIPQDQKWDAAFEQHIVQTYRRLSSTAAAFRPDLLIWPEAATPRPLLEDEEMKALALDVSRETGGDFLLGSIRYFLGGAFNAAVLLDQAGGLQVYHKMHLVPFGEYVPLRHTFPVFAWLVGDQVLGDFNAGAEPVVMRLRRKPVRIGPLICFEDTLGNLARRFADDGAQVLITLTNDGWFRRSPASRQHLANSVFRAAETKRPLLRAANTGVTCFIDRFGAVERTLEIRGSTFIEGVLLGEVRVPLQPPRTFYTRYGDLFSLLCAVLAILSLRTHLLTARRSNPPTAPTAGKPTPPPGQP